MDAAQFQQLVLAFSESQRQLLERIIPRPAQQNPAQQQITNPNITLISNFDSFDPAHADFKFQIFRSTHREICSISVAFLKFPENKESV